MLFYVTIVLLCQHTAFTFDRIFKPDSEQKDVFDTTTRPILEDMFAGYYATVFAYGQTGSGKTWTMEVTSDIVLGTFDTVWGAFNMV